MAKRHSKHVTSTKRWQALRQQAQRRDGYRCVNCNAAGRMEVDHIQPVRSHPHLSFELTNLQCLCASCHAIKTRIENGATPLSPQRQQWRDLMREERKSSQATQGLTHA